MTGHGAFAAALLASAVLVGAASSARAASEPVATAVEQALLARGVGPRDAPGCAVRVRSADGKTFTGAYGAADLEHGIPFQPETVSETGSVAKQVTAAEVLLLVEDGRLSLDQDIRSVLPELPNYGAPVRISDLLHQTSGIREWATLAALRGYPRFYRKAYTMADMLRLIADQRTLNFPPGTRYEYSNSNYGLLTLIVERVSGESAQAFAARRIFGPLGMTQSQWRDDLRRLVPDRALAYRRSGSGYALYPPLEEVYGHGALLTTVGDLQIWNMAVLSGRLSPFVTRQMLTPGRLRNGERRDYGGGVVLGDYRGHPAIRHGGVTAGYTAQLWGFPAAGVSIAMLCNLQVPGLADIAARAADAALGLPPETPAAPDTAPVPVLAPGFYRAPSGEMIAIGTAPSGTWVDLFDRKGQGRLVRAAGGGFTTHESPGLKLEVLGPAAVSAALDTREPERFDRVTPAPASAWPVGRFESRDLGATFAIRRSGADLRMSLEDPRADDPIAFDLQWLTGDTYLARLQTRSGYIRDDFVIHVADGGLTLSSVMGLQGVDRLWLPRIAEALR